MIIEKEALGQEAPMNRVSLVVGCIKEKKIFHIIFSEDGPNLVKRDRNITISLGQGPFYGSIGIGLVHTMSNMLNKTIQVANTSKRQLFQGMTNIRILRIL